MKILATLLVFLSIIVSLGSCTKDPQKLLVGNWEQIPNTNPETTTLQTFWEFYAGNAVHIYKIENEVIIDSLRFIYDINGDVFEVFSGEDDPGYAKGVRDPRGQYWVDDISSSQFKATKRKHPDGTTESVYVRLELMKR